MANAEYGSRVWWAHQDLNLEPADYEPAALTIELWARRPSLALGFRRDIPHSAFRIDKHHLKLHQVLPYHHPSAEVLPRGGGPHLVGDLRIV